MTVRALTALATLAAMTGCAEPEAVEASPLAQADREHVVAADAVADLPSSLQCVTEGDIMGDVVRLWGWRSGATANVTFSKGPMFMAHAGVWADTAGESVTRDLALSGGAGRFLLRDDDKDATVASLAQEGLFFHGTLVDDGERRALTCWNPEDFFWGYGQLGPAVEARFDWQTGTCKNAAGVAALNHWPLAVVRETGVAECADLSGAELNGGDFNMPDLYGWNLMGAKLKGAQLFFANLVQVNLAGADLRELQFGYADITGWVDAHTQLPQQDGCEMVKDEWGSVSLACKR